MSNISQPSTTRTAPTTDDVVLEIENASVTFDMDRGTSRVLDGVDLDVRRNEILGVVGESGSGKSMLASVLLDAVDDPGRVSGDVVYHPEDGGPVDVLDLGRDELKRLRWNEISMVFQGAMSSFNPTMTIRGHFRETLEAHDVDVSAGMDRARELLSDLYLDPERVLGSYAHELSGGMSQRALIALSLILEPDVLVMDEPTAALDLLMQRSILGLLEELRDKYDLTVVFITHDLPLVAGLADRLAVMYAFDLVEQGPTEDLVADAAHPYTRALLRAVPNLDAPLSTMRAIEGAAPDPVESREGCSYAPRCPIADEHCRSHDPKREAIGDGDRRVACFNWDEAAEAVPFEESVATEQSRTPADIDSSASSGGTPTRMPGESGSPSGDPVVSVDDLSVEFEREKGLFEFFTSPEVVQAVSDVSLDIYENDVVALVGESGCGKTTLGKAAIGVQRPTRGAVEYRGQDLEAAKSGSGQRSFDEIRKSLQIIHQDPGSSLNPNQTVLKSLRSPLKQWKPELDADARRERIYDLLARVGMEPPRDYAHRFPHQLSGGEQQRVALVRALLMDPAMILADEAISALDVSLRVEVMDLMLELQDEFDTSFLFISHNLSNARYLAGNAGGRIGVMYLGELVEIGSAEDVLGDPKHPYTQVLQWATADLEPDDGEVERPPIRAVDVPDPVDPPSGCRFHTRCPKARELCTERSPDLDDDGGSHCAACFRDDPDHEYWDSDPLPGTDADESGSERSP